jgi:hypothetical protein
MSMLEGRFWLGIWPLRVGGVGEGVISMEVCGNAWGL